MTRPFGRSTIASGADSPRHSSPEGHRVSQEPGQRDGGTSPLDLLLMVALSLVLIFGVVRPFIVESFSIPSASMEPTLLPGDSVLTLKFYYRLFGPHRGDLVAFKSPERAGEVLIKRVVGLSGDVVEVRDSVVFVNGEPQKESYVDHRLIDGTYFGPVRVPEGRLFVMGDNRFNSRDSRDYGPVPEKDLIGKVVLRFWPPARVDPL